MSITHFWRTIFFSILFFCFFVKVQSQTISGQVRDTIGKPLPFATIKFANSREGVVADLNGNFTINKPVELLEVSYLNYTSQRIKISDKSARLNIVLIPAPANLNVVIVKTTSNKIKRIINAAIANRDLNNPDKYNWYRCKVYYKMIADFVVPDAAGDRRSRWRSRPPHGWAWRA